MSIISIALISDDHTWWKLCLTKQITPVYFENVGEIYFAPNMQFAVSPTVIIHQYIGTSYDNFGTGPSDDKIIMMWIAEFALLGPLKEFT